MKKIKSFLFGFFIISSFFASAQGPVIDSIKFFTDESLIDMSITTDIKTLQSENKLDVFQDAEITMRFPDSSVVTTKIAVGARGHFRRDFCTIPPLLLNFRGNSKLSSLGKLKLVIGCGNKADDEQLILKEYLAYKVYNLLEQKSFRVRLVRVNYNDSRNKMRSFTQYAFFIEDDADMAKRNGCVKKDKAQVLTINTNRDQMTMVAVFEYMISNGDWSVPNNHNTKLIYEKKNAAARPYVVPYDFDHSGFVNAGYAVPNEILGTEKVTERVYRGFPRTEEELQSVFDEFKEKRQAINSLIMNFALLKERTRKEAVEYLDEFYKTIDSKSQVKAIFIEGARTQ